MAEPQALGPLLEISGTIEKGISDALTAIGDSQKDMGFLAYLLKTTWAELTAQRARVAERDAQVAAIYAKVQPLVEAIETLLLASAKPHPDEHKAMAGAWRMGTLALGQWRLWHEAQQAGGGE